MILPIADTLQNCLQNLTSRIAGVDNEQMTNRVVGMGAMLGFGLGAIKEQFKTPSSSNLFNNGNNDNSAGGLKGFVSRAKSVINPTVNLSPETDYNENINPIRNVIPKEKQNSNVYIPTSNGENKASMSNGSTNAPKTVVGKVAKTGFNMTKSYLSMGAKMAEGDFSKSPYKNNNTRKNNFQNTEYINKVANSNEIKKLGDESEFKGKNKK